MNKYIVALYKLIFIPHSHWRLLLSEYTQECWTSGVFASSYKDWLIGKIRNE
jgi:hypothetical protein